MKKAKVIVLAVSHKNRNHIFKDGDIITEIDVNNFDELVKTKKLELITEKEEKEPEKEKKKPTKR